jgi:josephin
MSKKSTKKIDPTEKLNLYHEKQKLQLCALHSLNNLFQNNHFDKHALDAIVHEFDKSWCWNEYSSLFTGNYDLTIILEALKRKGYTLRAIDINEAFERFDFKDCFGLLLNITIERPYFDRLPLVRKFTKPSRHWLAIKSIDGEQFYDLDSKLSKPKLIGNQTNLIAYLNALDRAQSYMYIVIEESMAEKFEQT